MVPDHVRIKPAWSATKEYLERCNFACSMFNNVLLAAAALRYEAMYLLLQFYKHLLEEDRIGCFTVNVVLLYMRVSLFVFVLISLPRGKDK